MPINKYDLMVLEHPDVKDLLEVSQASAQRTIDFGYFRNCQNGGLTSHIKGVSRFPQFVQPPIKIL